VKRPDPNDATSLVRVRHARRDATPAERLLWSRLQARQLSGAKFRRQVWLGSYIADFYCAEARLVVEVDGDTHALQEAYDKRRTDWLESQSFSLVRVTNGDVMRNLEGVLEHIASVLPSPSRS
jgi:adenine-specific DNA-methyltransferase